jgi:probable rRNA maturation factor
MSVRLRIEDGPHDGLDRREVARRARVIFRALRLGEAELSIVLGDDARVRELNRTYRGIDKATDVLAFAMREGDKTEIANELLGDVVVSVETARRQAGMAGHDLLAEVTMLLAHGVLHLTGWDHATAAQSRLMRAETARLVALAAAPAKARRR